VAIHQRHHTPKQPERSITIPWLSQSRVSDLHAVDLHAVADRAGSGEGRADLGDLNDGRAAPSMRAVMPVHSSKPPGAAAATFAAIGSEAQN
jgi:hypothetical protein